MICVSKCLMGHNCRYDGKNMKNDAIIEYLKDKEYWTPKCVQTSIKNMEKGED